MYGQTYPSPSTGFMKSKKAGFKNKHSKTPVGIRIINQTVLSRKRWIAKFKKKDYVNKKGNNHVTD